MFAPLGIGRKTQLSPRTLIPANLYTQKSYSTNDRKFAAGGCGAADTGSWCQGMAPTSTA